LKFLKIQVAVVLITAAFFSNACKSKKEMKSTYTTTSNTNQTIKLNSFWVIAAFYENGNVSYPQTKLATISIANDLKSFTGETGCNSMRGPLTITGDSIKFGHIAHTRRSCEHSATEQKVLQALQQVNRYEIKSAELTLFQNQTPIIQFESYRN